MSNAIGQGSSEPARGGADSNVSSGSGMSQAQLHHHENRFLQALKLLIDSGKARTVDDLIRYAEQDKQAEAVGYLKTASAEKLPVDLAYDALCVHTRIVAHKRNNSLLANCQGRRVGLVLPLPHHVIDAFTSLTDVTLLVPDGHHVPPHLRSRSLPNCESTRAARAAVEKLDVLVLEAFAASDGHYVEVGTADVVDMRIVPTETQLIVHVRPHRNPDDILLPCQSRSLNVL